jgi:hypothetical protein
MKGFLKDGPAAGQAVEVGDPPTRRGMIVLDGAAFGEQVHRYYLSEVDGSGAVYTCGGVVPWPPEAGRPVIRRRHDENARTQLAAGSDEPNS